MDVNPQRLSAAHALCQRYADEVGAALHLQATTDRRESLQGADFVINTALVAGHQMMMDGIRIASNLGYRYGGSYHIMHDEPFWLNYYQFKFFDALTEDMLEICPHAWHLLVANPVLAGTTHITRKYPGVRMIGLCHGYANLFQVATVLELEQEGLTYELSGLNHFSGNAPLYEKARPFTRLVIDAYTPQRMVWGSGTPRIVDAHLDRESEAERAQVKGGNLARLLAR